MNRFAAAVAVGGALWLSALPAAALESDRDQPIRVKARQVTMNENTGLATYEGGVEAVQGSLRLRADRMVVRRREGRTEHVHGAGRPLTMQQKPDADSPTIYVEAKRMEYDVASGVLELFGAVVARQGQDVLRSDYLYYRLDGERLRARAAPGGTDRVQAVLHPKGAPGAAP